MSGCSRSDSTDKEFRDKYNSFVDAIIDNNNVETNDIPFSHTLTVEKDSDGSYRYEVTIDNPKIAMYNIQMMVVDKSVSADYPFIGLLPDEDSYSMIPFQENRDKFFVKGIKLGGISQSPTFTLNIIVTWKDYAKLNTTTAFFNYTYDYDKEQAAKAASEENGQ